MHLFRKRPKTVQKGKDNEGKCVCPSNTRLLLSGWEGVLPTHFAPESVFSKLLLGAGVAPLRDLELAVNRHSLQS